MQFIDNQQLHKVLTFDQLIPALAAGFKEQITAPLRHHHQFKNPVEGIDSTLLLMPAWKAGAYLGIKIVTVAPNNTKYHLPSIQGTYILFDALKASPIAQMDAKLLTSIRTAAASALASSFLSQKNSRSLLMLGTGAMATHLIKAHATVRPIENVYVWGRTYEKALAVANALKDLPLRMQAIRSIEEKISEVDIISSATLSNHALVHGVHLRAGQHVDLVGSFKPDMREADDRAIRKSSVWVDTLEGATRETGDILIPLNNGSLDLQSIRGDLFSLCAANTFARNNEKEITLFKSVGHALEDLVAARLVWERLNSANKP